MRPHHDGPVWRKAAPGRAGSPLVVVVDGVPGGHRDGPRLLRRLVRRGYQVAVVVPDAAAWRSAAAGTWLAGLAVGRRDAAVEVRLLGFGPAGALALRAAAHDPAVRAVHLLGTPVGLPHLEARPRPATAARLQVTALENEPPRQPLHAMPLTPAELYEVRAPIRYAYNPDDPVTPPRDVALLKLAVRHCEFTVLSAGDGGTPHGPAARRWVVAGLPRTRHPRWD
ncbi:hypothetical protein WJ438_34045 [Streptomyces sp. GD-15H]|uniref:hypothetical protein n=1 Tax=Streptomyces sp. GD-15H TaxID=3129112 RepID=UPI00324C7229